MSRKIFLCLLLAVALSGTVVAQGVELNPAYITGTLSLANADYASKVSSAYVYANADGGFSASTQAAADGTYTLTVNAPADGSERQYSVYANITLKSGIQFATATQTIVVTKGSTQTADFSGSLGTLKINLSATNGNISSYTFLIFNSSGPNLYAILSTGITPAASTVLSVDFPAGIPAYYVWAFVYPQDPAYQQGSAATEGFTVNAGETTEQTFSVTFPPVPATATLMGTVELDGIPSSLVFANHSISPPGVSIPSNPGSYTTDQASIGQQWASVTTYFTNGVSFSWPYKSVVPGSAGDFPYFNVVAGQVNELSPTMSLAGTLHGNLQFTGVGSLSDVPSYYRSMYFNGTYGTDSYGGYVSQSSLNGNTGEFTLPVSAGTWTYNGISFTAFQKNLTDPENYVLCYLYGISDQRGVNEYTVSAGQSIDGILIQIPTGSVKIKFAVTDGSLVSNPSLSFSYQDVDASGNTIFSGSGSASGPSQALAENQATIVGPPGTYTVNASATVNGSSVTFNPKTVIVIEGVEQVLEINGPSLSVSSPQAELYTYDDQVTVSGIADDDVHVASVTLNDTPVTITSTGNADKPNEVSFSLPFTLVNGPNKIVVKATDSAGKIAQDTRFVYKDRSAPTLAFTPATSSTRDSSVTVQGTATDDNAVSQVFVNGLAVPFSWSGNTSDPNEVSYQTTITLKDGANPITVTVVDNCKRTTAETHVVTRSQNDVTPPVFPALSDVTLEQAGPTGTAYTLPVPAVTDDEDPSPTVSSNAPAVFPAGVTTVTWTATDASGNSSTATQKVTVADTTPPTVTAPANVTLEYTGTAATLASLGTPTVHDAVDPAPSVSASIPAVWPLGVTKVVWTARDASGNSASAVQTVTVVDTTPPVTTASVGNPQVRVDKTLYISGSTPIAFSATDLVGVASISYDLGGGPQTYSSPITIPTSGTYTLSYHAVDTSGNSESVKTLAVTVDAAAPVISITGVTAGGSYTGAVTPVITVSDPLLASSSISLNGTAYTSGTPITAVGAYTLSVSASDQLGNGSNASVSFTIASTIEVPACYFLQPHKLLVYWDGAPGAIGYHVYVNGKPVSHGFFDWWWWPWHDRDRDSQLVKDTSWTLEGIHDPVTIVVKAVNAKGGEFAVAAQLTVDAEEDLTLEWPRLAPSAAGVTIKGGSSHHQNMMAYYAVIDGNGRRTAWVPLGAVSPDGRSRFSFIVPLNDQTRGKSVALRVTGVDTKHGDTEETGLTIKMPGK